MIKYNTFIEKDKQVQLSTKRLVLSTKRSKICHFVNESQESGAQH